MGKYNKFNIKDGNYKHLSQGGQYDFEQTPTGSRFALNLTDNI
jgi:hypothetical protein